MKKKTIVKLMTFNLGFAILMVVLFSPGLVGLSFDGSPLRTALAAACLVTCPILFFVVNRHFIKEDSAKKVIVSGDWQGLAQELHTLRSRKVLGGIAKDAARQVESFRTSSQNYKQLIERIFSPGSLSHSKFLGVVNASEEVLRKNIAEICNRCAIFNESDYLALQDYKNDRIDDAIQEERIATHKANLAGMHRILEGNEKIMLHLEKLMLGISDTEFDESAALRAAEEIDGLIGHLKYYENTGLGG